MRIFGIFMLTGVGVFIAITDVSIFAYPAVEFTFSNSGWGFMLNLALLFLGVATGITLTDKDKKDADKYFSELMDLVELHNNYKRECTAREEYLQKQIKTYSDTLFNINPLAWNKGGDDD